MPKYKPGTECVTADICKVNHAFYFRLLIKQKHNTL